MTATTKPKTSRVGLPGGARSRTPRLARQRLRAGFRLDGRDLPGNDYSDLAFLAPATVGALLEPDHPEWLEGLWDKVVGPPLDEADYYGNTLKALALLAASGNAWRP